MCGAGMLEAAPVGEFALEHAVLGRCTLSAQGPSGEVDLAIKVSDDFCWYTIKMRRTLQWTTPVPRPPQCCSSIMLGNPGGRLHAWCYVHGSKVFKRAVQRCQRVPSVVETLVSALLRATLSPQLRSCGVCSFQGRRSDRRRGVGPRQIDAFEILQWRVQSCRFRLSIQTHETRE